MGRFGDPALRAVSKGLYQRPLLDSLHVFWHKGYCLHLETVAAQVVRTCSSRQPGLLQHWKDHVRDKDTARQQLVSCLMKLVQGGSYEFKYQGETTSFTLDMTRPPTAQTVGPEVERLTAAARTCLDAEFSEVRQG
jgi:hypothetical protein